MERKTSLLKSFIPALFSFLLILGTMTVFHPCDAKEDGTWMHCHDVQTAVAAGGFLLMVLLIGAVFVRPQKLKTGMLLLGVIGSGVVFLLPGVIMPMCMMQTMRCYAVMQPFVRILSALVCLSSLLQMVRSFRKQ